MTPIEREVMTNRQVDALEELHLELIQSTIEFLQDNDVDLAEKCVDMLARLQLV